MESISFSQPPTRLAGRNASRARVHPVPPTRDGMRIQHVFAQLDDSLGIPREVPEALRNAVAHLATSPPMEYLIAAPGADFQRHYIRKTISMTWLNPLLWLPILLMLPLTLRKARAYEAVMKHRAFIVTCNEIVRVDLVDEPNAGVNADGSPIQDICTGQIPEIAKASVHPLQNVTEVVGDKDNYPHGMFRVGFRSKSLIRDLDEYGLSFVDKRCGRRFVRIAQIARKAVGGDDHVDAKRLNGMFGIRTRQSKR